MCILAQAMKEADCWIIANPGGLHGFKQALDSFNSRLPPSIKPYDLGEHLANYGLLYLAATIHGGHSEIFRDSMKEQCIRPPLCIGRRYGIGKRRHETWKKHMQASASLYHTTLKISFPLLHSFLLSSLLLSSFQNQCVF